MNNTINGRTPGEIKKGLECCCKTILFRDVQDYLKEIKISAARIEDMTKQLESAQPKWISVEERLPEPDKDVLTLKNRKHVRIGYYSEDCEEWVINDMIAYDEDITHWMPLPSTEGIE